MNVKPAETLRLELQNADPGPNNGDAQRCRTKKFTKPIRRFSDDGRPTAEYLAEQALYPAASNATKRASGVDSDVAAGAIGQLILASAFPSFRFRQDSPLTDLLRLQRVSDAPTTARVYRERNGAGQEFFRVRYDLPRCSDGKRRQRSIYLGSDPDIADWARDILHEKRWREKHWDTRTPDYEKADQAKRALRRCKTVAQAIAKCAGYYFHGSRLRERRQ